MEKIALVREFVLCESITVTEFCKCFNPFKEGVNPYVFLHSFLRHWTGTLIPFVSRFSATSFRIGGTRLIPIRKINVRTLFLFY